MNLERDIKCKIRTYIREDYWDEDKLADDSDIFGILNIDGDDCSEFFDDFAELFDVNFDDLLWYFHHADEVPDFSISNIIYPRPYRLVERIPITINMLAEAAETKKWCYDYPDHELPNYRFATLIDVGSLIAFIGFLAVLVHFLESR